MFSAFCLLSVSAILFFIIKYRVHVHVTLQVPGNAQSSRRGRKTGRGDSTLPLPSNSPEVLYDAATRHEDKQESVRHAAIRKAVRDPKGARDPEALRGPGASSAGTARMAETPKQTQAPTQDRTRPVVISATPESIVWGDVASALVNLGADKKQARAAAMKACREYPDAPFNSVFTAALQEVGRAA